MSNRLALRYNTGPQDGSLFALGFEYCLFKYQPWEVAGDKVRQTDKTTFVQSEISPGKKIALEFEKTGTFLEDVIMKTTYGPVTGIGAGTYARFIDWAGLGVVQKIEVTYQQNTIQSYDNLGLFIDYFRDHDITHRNVFRDGLAGGLSTSRRNTRALSNQVFSTYLKPYWYGMRGHCPLLTALANKIRILIYLAPLTDILESDYTQGATSTLTQIEFLSEIINLTGADRESAVMPTFTPRGLSYLVQRKSVISYQKIPAGTTSYVVNLSGLTNPFYAIYFILQRNSEQNTNFQKKPFKLNISDFKNISYSAFRDSSNIKLQEISDYRDFANIWQKFHCGSQWVAPIGFYSATEIADLKNACLGSWNAQNINNFQHEIKFSTPLAEDLLITYVIYEHNWINHQAGEISTVFN